MIVFRYLARAYLGALIAALVGMCTLYLIIDFADRARFFTGPGWLEAVIELYLCKLAVTAHQLAPAALALGAAIAMSALRRRGEVTALRSLGRGVGTFAVPVATVTLVFSAVLMAAEDPVVVPANYRAEEITALRFHRWGDWKTYHWNRRWYRGATGHIYYLGRIEDKGFVDVAVYELDDDFRLTRRVDASRITPAEGGGWKLTDAVVRTFAADGSMVEKRAASMVETFPDDLREFRVKTGRPSQLRRRELPEQIELRQKLALPVREWQLALHERRAYQLTSVPVAVVGACLALRRNRRGHLTTAIAEGFAVTIALWALSALSRTLTLAGHLSPMVGGWLPLVVSCAVMVFALRKAR